MPYIFSSAIKLALTVGKRITTFIEVARHNLLQI